MLPRHGEAGAFRYARRPFHNDTKEEATDMSIPILLAACLLTDPSLQDSGSVLAASDIGRASVRAFDTAVLATVDPSIDPSLLVFAGDRAEPDFSYSYAEIGYARTKIADFSSHSNTGYIEGSFGFLDHFRIFGSYQRENTDFDSASLDGYTLGGGVHFGVMPKLDLVGDIAWLFNHIDSSNLFTGDNENGVSIFAGARWMVLPDLMGGLEADGGLRYSDVTSLASNKAGTALELGGRLHFSRLLSLGLTYDYRESDQRLAFDARFSF
jgi:hypothetical protein